MDYLCCDQLNLSFIKDKIAITLLNQISSMFNDLKFIDFMSLANFLWRYGDFV